MILAIDAGNTHTVLGCIDENNQVHQMVQLATDRTETAHGYAVKIKQVFELEKVDMQDFEGAIISSVVPPVTEVLKKAVKLITGIDALVVGAGIKTGLKIAIDDPATLAGDLVATAIAVKEEYPLPCVIIDMGTATTLTVVNEAGEYIGGAILPGVGISLNALTEDTSLLPRIEIVPPQKVIATNTVESMKTGVVYGAAGAIDGILERFSEELGKQPASIVTTGGLGGLICPYCRHKIIVDRQLLLKGLGITWQRNQKNK